MSLLLSLLSLLLFVSLSFAVVLPAGRHAIAERKGTDSHYRTLGWRKTLLSVPQDMEHEFHIFLKLRSDARLRLKETLTRVSDPNSPLYGRHLKKGDIVNLVHSGPSHSRVLSWLEAHGLTAKSGRVESFGDRLHVKATTATIEKLFAGRMRHFQHHRASEHNVFRVDGLVTIPSELKEDVDFVAGLTELFDPIRSKIRNELKEAQIGVGSASSAPQSKKRTATNPENALSFDPEFKVRTSRADAPKNSNNNKPHPSPPPPPPPPGPSLAQMTPQIIKKYYNVTSVAAGPDDNNMNSVGAFSETFSAKALAQFGSQIAKSETPFAIYKVMGPTTGADDETEGDLDVQYIQSMSPGTKSWFWGVYPNFWILQWTVDVFATDPVPIVHSLSYGFGIEEQCAIATVWCQVLGYNSSQYVDRTNAELQKLGVRGITVLVSSGDDGAPGRGNNGHCPLDGDAHYCPIGGCPHKTSLCPGLQLTVQLEDLKSDCVLPLGIFGFGCSGVAQSLGLDGNDLSSLFDYTSKLFTSQKLPLQWEQDQEGNPQLYSSAPCSQISTSVQNPDFGLLTVSGFLFDPSDEAIGDTFMDSYPGSSPWVTSVGMTTILDVNKPEQVGSILNGGIVSSGGGFSIHEAQESYQADFVSDYLSKVDPSLLPPSQMFDGTLRAYPDVSLTGERYVILTSSGKSGKIQQAVVSGTSASSPTFAGMLTLINAALLARNASALGFLNPLLYQFARDEPSGFNHITQGDNRCTSNLCCKYGFYATPNSLWNPATGLGSPKFDRLLSYALRKQGRSL